MIVSGLKRASLKVSVIHKPGWEEVHHFVKKCRSKESNCFWINNKPRSSLHLRIDPKIPKYSYFQCQTCLFYDSFSQLKVDSLNKTGGTTSAFVVRELPLYECERCHWETATIVDGWPQTQSWVQLFQFSGQQKALHEICMGGLWGTVATPQTLLSIRDFTTLQNMSRWCSGGLKRRTLWQTYWFHCRVWTGSIWGFYHCHWLWGSDSSLAFTFCADNNWSFQRSLKCCVGNSDTSLSCIKLEGESVVSQSLASTNASKDSTV